jgi:hypothetical protein
MPRHYYFFVVLVLIFTVSLQAQFYRVSPEQWGERLVAVVPLVGNGRPDNPIRPKFVPAPLTAAERQASRLEGARLANEAREGKIDRAAEIVMKRQLHSFSWVLSDDGKSAIVEFVAAHRDAFAEILQDKAVKVFDKKATLSSEGGKQAAKDELRRVKKDFEWEDLRTAVLN